MRCHVRGLWENDEITVGLETNARFQQLIGNDCGHS